VSASPGPRKASSGSEMRRSRVFRDLIPAYFFSRA
jgi:hypothetical protein